MVRPSQSGGICSKVNGGQPNTGGDVVKELLETLAQALVDKPEEVNVTVVEGEQSVILQLHVAPDDVGKVIGKEGRIAKALRVVVKAAAVKNGKKAIVEIID